MVPGDLESVVGLVDRDRVPGQPVVTSAMVAEAVAGRSLVDAGWWAELSELGSEVLLDERGAVVGVVGFGSRRRDNALVLLWLHAAEVPEVVARLVDRVVSLAAGRVVHAFSFATALSVGLEGLPVRHRPVTHRALLRAGFTDADLWRYLLRDLTGLPPDAVLPAGCRAAVTASEDPAGWTIELLDAAGRCVAEASAGVPTAELGVLWWIGVNEHARGQGLGRVLLVRALRLLRERGAHQVVLVVDDDEPGGDRDRTTANRLYDATGFREIDRLHSYEHHPGPRPATDALTPGTTAPAS